MRHRSAETGYTLIEVLVAMTILAMTLTVLFRVFAIGLRNAQIAQDYTRAIAIAESQLALPDIDGPEGLLHESDRSDFTVIRSVRQVAPDEVPDLSGTGVHAVEITVSVAWQSGAKPRTVTLSSLLLVDGEAG